MGNSWLWKKLNLKESCSSRFLTFLRGGWQRTIGYNTGFLTFYRCKESQGSGCQHGKGLFPRLGDMPVQRTVGGDTAFYLRVQITIMPLVRQWMGLRMVAYLMSLLLRMLFLEPIEQQGKETMR
jgi:hypothetical protein